MRRRIALSICRGFRFLLCNVEKRNRRGCNIGCDEGGAATDDAATAKLAKIPFAAGPSSADKLPAMKLRQNQVWKVGDGFLRIVTLERLEVRYKAMKNLATGEGRHETVTKKEFCRLIKGATLQDSLSSPLRMPSSRTRNTASGGPHKA